jgi:hypothetical protein
MNKKIIILNIITLLILTTLILGCTQKPNYENNDLNQNIKDQNLSQQVYSKTSLNPFGVFHIEGAAEKILNLNAGTRLLFFQYNYEERGKDEYYGLYARTKDVDFDSVGTLKLQGTNSKLPGQETHRFAYCMSKGEEFEKSKEYVKRIVSRYSGTNNYGCSINNGVDCYSVGDGLYPNSDFRLAVQRNPISYWQIENEYIYQLKDCDNPEEEGFVSKELLEKHIKEISNVIRETNPSAKIIFPSLAGHETILVYDRYLDKFEWGPTDCQYTIIDYNMLMNNQKILQETLKEKERTEYLLKELKDYYDVIDFHYYGNDFKMSSAHIDWFKSLGLGDKQVISTEFAMPFYYFPLLGKDKPIDCTNPIVNPEYYDFSIQSEYLIKSYIIALHNGVEAIFWATLAELDDNWHDTFKRNSLLFADTKEKPVYYTYELMTNKLAGFNSIYLQHENVYRFTFEDKKDVYVAWSEEGNKYIDLSNELGDVDLRITFLVKEVDSRYEAILKESVVVSASSIPLSKEPVFIEVNELIDESKIDSRSRFGIDGASIQYFDKFNDLGIMTSGINGLTWNTLEPNPPNNGVSTYTLNSPQIKRIINAFEQSNRKVQLNLNIDSEWALERSGTSIDPRTGLQSGKMIKIKDEHMHDWINLVENLVSSFEIDYLQIDSEAENHWTNSEGFVDALCNAYSAVKRKSPKTLVMASGFNLGEYPAIAETNIGENLLNSNPEFKSKVDFISEVISKGKTCFDILSIHAGGSQNVEFNYYLHIEPTVRYYKGLLEQNKYDKPIWFDDLHSGAMYSPNASEIIELSNNNQNTIKHVRQEQSNILIKKLVSGFYAGAEKIFISSDVDWPNYHMPVWRYAGLLDDKGNPKPAYYTAKILVEKLDYFETVTKIEENVYKFTFENKKDVYVAWSEEGNKYIDLSNELGNVDLEITFLINEVDSRHKAITKESVVSASSVPLSKEPVFIEVNEEAYKTLLT